MSARNAALKYGQCTMLCTIAQLSPDAANPVGAVIRERHIASRATRLVGDSDRFLLVSFLGADGRTAPPNMVRRWLEKYAEHSLLSNGKRYTFFGFTSLHLKQARVIFFEEDDTWSVESLKAELGDLDAVFKEGGYGKYCVALGLSFLPTVASLEVDDHQVVEIPDDLGANGTIISKGCGMVRDSYAQKLCLELDIDLSTSVFHVSLGGIVGVVSRCPDDTFNEHTGHPDHDTVIAYRPSMRIHKGGPSMLEIHHISHSPRSAKLSFSLVYLLLTLGISLEVFKSLLRNRLEEIDSVAIDYQKAIMCVEAELDINSQAGDYKQELYEMLLAGQSLEEPHFRSLIERFQKQGIQGLQDDASIPVKDAFELLGVIDNSPNGVLEEGQVYINLPHRGGPQIGTFIIGKKSAYSPGDLRRLQGVNAPRLSHLRDCIVFSRKGCHSGIDKIDGGGLGSTLYCAIFSPLLVPVGKMPAPQLWGKPTRSGGLRQSLSNAISAGRWVLRYSLGRPNEETQPRPPQREAAIDVFIDHHLNKLATQATRFWSTQVGKNPELANSRTCQDLVPLIEASFDYTKGGSDLIELRKRLKALRTESDLSTSPTWEDPMHILQGVIFRAIGNRLDRSHESVLIPDPDLDVRSLVAPGEWNRFAEEAEVQLNAFLIEAEKERAGRDVSPERVAQIQERLQNKFRKDHFAPRHVLDTSVLAVKASVWYHIGYESQNAHFAWAGAHYLNYLKALTGGRPPISAVRSNMTCNIPIPIHAKRSREVRETNDAQSLLSTYASSQSYHSSDVEPTQAGLSDDTQPHKTYYAKKKPVPSHSRPTAIADSETFGASSSTSTADYTTTAWRTRRGSSTDVYSTNVSATRTSIGYTPSTSPDASTSTSTIRRCSFELKDSSSLSNISPARFSRDSISSSGLPNAQHSIAESAPVFGAAKQFVPPRQTVSAPPHASKGYPLAPAALEHREHLSNCTSAHRQHDWSRAGSNASVRRYRCKTCNRLVLERPDSEAETGWVPR